MHSCKVQIGEKKFRHRRAKEDGVPVALAFQVSGTEMRRSQPEKQKQTGFTGSALPIFPSPAPNKTSRTKTAAALRRIKMKNKCEI
jgi:hypothetical protein